MASEKSEFVRTMDELQVGLREVLQDKGFRVHGRTFNRVTADGLTEVLDLQMGRFPPPGSYHIPVLRENLYGRFTVNLGVFVPEVRLALLPNNPPSESSVEASYCCVRTRLGLIGPEETDIWWPIRRDEAILEDLRQRVIQDAFPFLARFDSRDAILAEWLHLSKSVYANNCRIVCAIILAERGRSNEARTLLAKQAEETNIPQHAAYVRSLAERLGLGALVKNT